MRGAFGGDSYTVVIREHFKILTTINLMSMMTAEDRAVLRHGTFLRTLSNEAVEVVAPPMWHR